MRKTNDLQSGAVRSDRGMMRPALMAVFLSTAALTGPMLHPAFAEDFSFSSVKVEGNQTVEAATILSYADIAKGQTLSAGALNAAYQRVVDSGLFETVELDPQGGTLVIRVTEFPMINIVNFEGNKRLKDEDLAKIAKSQGRRVYSPAQAEEDAALIAEAYRAKGRIAATVEPRIIRRDGNRVDLVFEIAEGKVVEIERLSFVGNRAFSDRRLRQVLETKQAGLLRTLVQRDTFVAERLDLDKQLLRDFYLSRGYADVQVLDATSDVSRERDAFFVTFTVKEGQQFKIGQTSTVSEIDGLDAAEFDAVKKIRSGQTWSPALIDTNVARMENLALEKGLTFVRIDPRITRNERNGELDVEFAVVRGERVFVERIDIEGNTTTMDQVVRRQFRSAEGDPFNPREIRQAAERIRALGFFADAQVNAEAGSAGDQVILNVDVEEQPTGSLTFGATYSVSNGLGFNAGLSETNFLGRGQALDLTLNTASDSSEATINFTEPAFLGRDLALKFGAGYKQTDNATAAYSTKSYTLNPAVEFPVGELTRLELRYKAASVDMFNVDSASSALLTAEGARGAEVASSIGYTISYDSRLNGVNPKGGVLLRFGQDYAGVGGDATYLSTNLFAMAETKVAQDEVALRTILEGGYIVGLNGYESRAPDRFYGTGKIRGFENLGIGPRDLTASNEDALGGNVYAVARFEADFPLGLPEEYGIDGGLFLDVGSVWGLDDTLSGTVDDAMHLRSAAGFSVFWDTPIGPLRFNFSKALVKEDYDREQNFDLTISTKF